MNFETIPEMYLRTCERFPQDQPLYMYKQSGKYKTMTVGEFRDKTEAFAAGLLEMGIRTGDRIGVVSENRIEWIIADFAIAIIGAISVPVFPTLTAKQMSFVFGNCQAVALIVSNEFQLKKALETKSELKSVHQIIVMKEDFESDDLSARSMKSVVERGEQIRSSDERRDILNKRIARIAPDDVHTIIYTSGTTGDPKGVTLTNANIVANIKGVLNVISFTPDDVFLSFLPLCHAYERTTAYYSGFSCGAVLALAESPDTVKTNIEEIRPTIMTTVPKLLEVLKKKIYLAVENDSGIKRKFFYWAVDTGIKYVKAKSEGKTSFALSAKYSLADRAVFTKIREKLGGRVRLFVSGGAALAPDVHEFFLAAGLTTIEGYGLTEASPVVSVQDPEAIEVGSIGKPFFNIEVKIAEDGELLVRGPSVMKGYWDDSAATDAAIDEDGWLFTGDIACLTNKGNLKITDRKKNIIVNSGGKNIAPQPIENLIEQSVFVDRAYLVGDRRDFLTALIIPDFDRIKDLADNLGIKYSATAELTIHAQIIAAIQKDIDKLQRDLAKYERVRKFALLSQPFTIESGELTPKMSVRRHVVERKYSGLIEQLYDMN